ncbi:hypothetical protein CLV54_3371 [Compostimonas suwonensis]|uniref:Uncharacterized protein n=1 Tax=Compostimonas suwonensis TaxID=1048394 RepID=A0A2M9BBC0_9MICO|nr:hypothetical protein CLV54_3371 [Compostimonas suwonensis]
MSHGPAAPAHTKGASSDAIPQDPLRSRRSARSDRDARRVRARTRRFPCPRRDTGRHIIGIPDAGVVGDTGADGLRAARGRVRRAPRRLRHRHRHRCDRLVPSRRAIRLRLHLEGAARRGDPLRGERAGARRGHPLHRRRARRPLPRHRRAYRHRDAAPRRSRGGVAVQRQHRRQPHVRPARRPGRSRRPPAGDRRQHHPRRPRRTRAQRGRSRRHPRHQHSGCPRRGSPRAGLRKRVGAREARAPHRLAQRQHNGRGPHPGRRPRRLGGRRQERSRRLRHAQRHRHPVAADGLPDRARGDVDHDDGRRRVRRRPHRRRRAGGDRGAPTGP